MCALKICISYTALLHFEKRINYIFACAFKITFTNMEKNICRKMYSAYSGLEIFNRL